MKIDSILKIARTSLPPPLPPKKIYIYAKGREGEVEDP